MINTRTKNATNFRIINVLTSFYTSELNLYYIVFYTYQGSKAQKDIFRQILLHAAAKSNTKQNLDLAMDILNNRLVEAKVKEHTPLNQR